MQPRAASRGAGESRGAGVSPAAHPPPPGRITHLPGPIAHFPGPTAPTRLRHPHTRTGAAAQGCAVPRRAPDSRGASLRREGGKAEAARSMGERSSVELKMREMRPHGSHRGAEERAAGRAAPGRGCSAQRHARSEHRDPRGEHPEPSSERREPCSQLPAEHPEPSAPRTPSPQHRAPGSALLRSRAAQRSGAGGGAVAEARRRAPGDRPI